VTFESRKTQHLSGQEHLENCHEVGIPHIKEIQDLQSKVCFRNLRVEMALNPGNNYNEPPTNRQKILRARSLPTTRPFNVAAFFYALHVLGLITTLAAVALFFKDPNEQVLKVTLGSLAFTIVAWFIAFLKRRKALCPLCKGTPLINSGALPHSKAIRLPILNHGVTATLSIITTQRFCCMYCGSNFDLLKPSAHLRRTRHDDSID
jgi:hypothetical protein